MEGSGAETSWGGTGAHHLLQLPVTSGFEEGHKPHSGKRGMFCKGVGSALGREGLLWLMYQMQGKLSVIIRFQMHRRALGEVLCKDSIV